MNNSSSTASGCATERRLAGAALLLAAAVASEVWLAAATRHLVPRRLAIYYGIPSLVNGAGGNVERAAAIFADYDAIVLGDGLQFRDVVPSRTPPGAGLVEHGRTAAIIQKLAASARRPVVYGYIDLGRTQDLSLEEIRRRISLWRQLGVGGIFFDEAGYDFGVMRPRQNAAADAAHAAGLRVVLNAFNPDDVFAVSAGTAHRLRPGDAYLLESFIVRNGEVEDLAVWNDRASRAVAHAARAGVDVYAVTTSAAEIPFSAALLDYAWWGALVRGIHAFGWGEPSFSASDSMLPWRDRPEPRAVQIGTRYLDDVSLQDGVMMRRTDRGIIRLDTRARVGEFRTMR